MDHSVVPLGHGQGGGDATLSEVYCAVIDADTQVALVGLIVGFPASQTPDN
jgi:hypothetical protein